MHAPFDSPFLSCDWGTSSFRLRWIVNGSVRRELRTDVGCRQLFDQSGGDLARRQQLFQERLSEMVALFENDVSARSPVPMVISGMASSTIGWVELPYASLPLDLSGNGLKVQSLNWKSPAFIGATLLVSGAASATDMMRGEETEAIGILSLVEDRPLDAILILPGTHSKHLRIFGNEIIDIQTFMTGELYELLSTQSVLRASVQTGETIDPDQFECGVQTALERGLSAALFQTRTRQVLRSKSKQANAAYLSGVIIGAEIAALKVKNAKVLLAATDPLRVLYLRAMDLSGIERTLALSQEAVAYAVPRAHALILGRHFAA